jgi:hypothetical protein
MRLIIDKYSADQTAGERHGDQDSDAQLHVNAFLGLRERKMCFNVRVNYRNDWKQKRSRVTVFADRSTRR